ncbi:MAG TPA: hypothetical protein VFC10_08460 [Terriglobia bacterium]|nr:hypothetical protein [Terriglobia bacterium]
MSRMKYSVPSASKTGRCAVRPSRRAGAAALLLCTAALFFAPVPARPADTSDSQQTLEGKLVNAQGTCPLLKTATKSVPLAGRYDYIFRTLEDKRLGNDDVRLEGKYLADGNFQVDTIYTIHHGELYRVRYYCETCNIVGLGPGKCVCCQQPTELQEVPVNKDDKNVLITH